MMRLAQARTEVPPSGMQAAFAGARVRRQDPPLWEGLGAATFKITTAVPEAQTYFNQGLRLAYGFNHGEAQRAFRKAQKLDPECAMCFWGEALVLGPNINLPMPEDAVAPAYAAAQKARRSPAAQARRSRRLLTRWRCATPRTPRRSARRSTRRSPAVGKAAARSPTTTRSRRFTPRRSWT